MPYFRMITTSLVVLALFVGCGKKKAKTDVVADSTSTALADSSANKDTTDVFDEFYTDDSESGNSESISSEPSGEPEFDSNGRYVVQVSCVLSQSIADDVVRKLKSKGYPAYVAEVENPTADLLGVYRRIRIGGFNGVSKAKEFGDNYLAAEGYDYWVDNKSNDNVGIGGSGLGGGSGTSSYQSDYGSGYDETTSDQGVDQNSATSNNASDDSETSSYDDNGSTTPSEPVATETNATTEPATTTATAEPQPATTPTTTTTSDDDWGTSGDDWDSDTTDW